MPIQFFSGPMAGTQVGDPEYMRRQQAMQGLARQAFDSLPSQGRSFGPGSGPPGPTTSSPVGVNQTMTPGGWVFGGGGGQTIDRGGLRMGVTTATGTRTGTSGPATPGAPGGGATPMEGVLQRQLRRIAAQRQAADRGAIQSGASRGLWRSQGRALAENQNRQSEASADAWQRFLAGEFENQRASQQGDAQRQFEERMQQQRLDLERERMNRELQAQQSAAGQSRQNALIGSILGGGGGGSERILSSTSRNQAAAERQRAAAGATGGQQSQQLMALQQQMQQQQPQQQAGGVQGPNAMVWDPYRGWVHGGRQDLPPLSEAVGQNLSFLG